MTRQKLPLRLEREQYKLSRPHNRGRIRRPSVAGVLGGPTHRENKPDEVGRLAALTLVGARNRVWQRSFPGDRTCRMPELRREQLVNRGHDDVEVAASRRQLGVKSKEATTKLWRELGAINRALCVRKSHASFAAASTVGEDEASANASMEGPYRRANEVRGTEISRAGQ